MTSQPMVSVLMPVLNGESYIGEAIKSILNQSYKNIELIIVNDASTDNTEKIIKSFKDKRVKYSKNNNCLGLANNRNKALTLAKGEFIAILDSDDISKKTRIAEQVTEFIRNKNLALCGTWTELIDLHGKHHQFWKFPTTNKALIAQFYIQFPIVHSSAMMRASILHKLKEQYKVSFSPAEDYELCFRLIHHGEVTVIPKFLTQYRVHGSNTSFKYTKTLSDVLPRLYLKEYMRINHTLGLVQLKQFVFFLHPFTVQSTSFLNNISIAIKLRQNIKAFYALSHADLISWDVYVIKTALLQIKNYFLGLTNQKQPQP